jgi:hypothetical protein
MHAPADGAQHLELREGRPGRTNAGFGLMTNDLRQDQRQIGQLARQL